MLNLLYSFSFFIGMKILAFTDTHNDPQGLRSIIRKAGKEKPDILVCCGDVSNFSSDLVEVVKKLNVIEQKILIIPGNHETPGEIAAVCRKWTKFVDIHEKYVVIDDTVFIGYGTGGFAMRDPHFEKLIPSFKKMMQKGKKIVFVTHPPVYRTKLDHLPVGHQGNKSTRKFIEEAQPDLVLCGHFHENEKKWDKIKKTLIINPGFDGMIVEI